MSVIINSSTKLSLELDSQDTPAQVINNKDDTNQDSTADWMPQELTLNIFKYLGFEDLAKASQVCKEWNQIASDNSLWDPSTLKKRYPSLRIIDKSVWQNWVNLATYGLCFNDASPLKKGAVLQALQSLSASLKNPNESEIILLTIPKGLTVKTLTTIAQSLKSTTSTLKFIEPSILENLEDLPISKTYTVAISNILPGSTTLSAGRQEEMVAKMGCEMPGVINATAVTILTSDSPATEPAIRKGGLYTRCSEQVDGCNLIVGSSSLSNLHLRNPHPFSANNCTGVRAQKTIV